MFNDLTKSSIIVYMKKSISTGESPLKYLLYICLFLICFCIGLIGGNRYFQYLSDEARPPEQKSYKSAFIMALATICFNMLPVLRMHWNTTKIR